MSVQPAPEPEQEAMAEEKQNKSSTGAGEGVSGGGGIPSSAGNGPEICAGFLQKKGMLGFKRRFFVLYESGLLQFHAGDDACPRRKVKGSMQLGPESTVRGGSKPFEFHVVSEGKSLVVIADNAAELDNWSQCLRECIRALVAKAGRATSDGDGEGGDANEPVFRVQEVMGARFHYESRYSELRPIGQGAYGMVVQAVDAQDGQKVAIKKSKEVFNNVNDAKRAVREIRLLRILQHPNIVKIKDMYIPNARGKFTDIYLVLELMDTNLHRVIYSPQDLSEDHKKYVLFQVLCGLKFLHSAGVIHRDLKPSNVLINADCKVKICDFGLSREIEDERSNVADDSDKPADDDPQPDSQMTEYVITRWYRAPEVMLVSGRYGTAVDMWSVGCIYAEMCRRKALFKGRDYVDQLTRIFRVLGKPTEEGISFVKKRRAREFVLSLPDTQPMNIPDVCRPRNIPWEDAKHVSVDADGMDMLEKILVLNPAERLTVQQALDHPFLASLAEEEELDPQLEGVDLSALVDMTDIETMELTRANLRRVSVDEMKLIRRGWIGMRGHQLSRLESAQTTQSESGSAGDAREGAEAPAATADST